MVLRLCQEWTERLCDIWQREFERLLNAFAIALQLGLLLFEIQMQASVHIRLTRNRRHHYCRQSTEKRDLLSERECVRQLLGQVPAKLLHDRLGLKPLDGGQVLYVLD